MKATVFYLYLFFLLLAGKQSSYAFENHNTKNVSSKTVLPKKHSKFIADNQNIILIDDTYLNFEEECHSGNNVKNGSDSKFLLEKNNFLNNWHSKHFRLFFLNYFNNFYKISQLLLGYSTPIYISLGVLRI